MQKFKRGVFGAGLAGLVMSLVVACGGGGGGGNFAGIDRLGVTTGTITGFGSIIVNGVEYETNNASFNIDDNPAGQIGSLEVGQVVTVRWSSSDDGVTRRADEVIYDDAVEGPISSIDLTAQSFVVLGQTIVVDADTSFASPLFDLGSLAAGEYVEVSGLVDGTGAVRATRIEREAAGGEIEIRGIVTGRTATTFAINTQVVNTATAVIDAPGGVIGNGDFVEAKGTFVNGPGQLVATRVELEDGGDSVGDDGEEAEVEGYVTSFTSASAFSVAGIPVQSSVAATGGTVALGAKVRVKGEFSASGVIVADEVEVRAGAGGSNADARIAANVDSVNVAGGQLVVLGITVLVDANTRLEDQSDEDVREFSLADLRGGANPDFVEVRGVPQGSNTIRATLLQRQEPDSQGRLDGRLGTLADPDFTILGVLVQTDDFTSFFIDENVEISAQDFFGGAVAAGDGVEVKFPLNPPGASTPILAEEVEISD
ncbi:MAG: DUF5666 domain-containing protein [Gammaproteobacteria bacterium]|nr:DUF5666 domain-containing protein [Gammaproteobacteria bacterium]